MGDYLAPLTPALLARIGEALYGPNHWRAPLARAVSRSERTVQFWLAGEHTPPDDITRALRDLLRDRGKELKTLLDDTIR